MYELFGAFIFQSRLNKEVIDAEKARKGVRDMRSRVTDLEEQIDRLTLVCSAMWTLLQPKLGLTDLELLGAIREIDLRDGKLDRKYNAPPLVCPRCGKANSHRQNALCIAKRNSMRN